MKAFVAFDQTMSDRMEALDQQLTSGQLTVPAWSDRLESDVVQPWIADKTRLQKLRVDAPLAKYRDRMVHYADLRARAIHEAAKGKRDRDAAAAKRANELQDELQTLGPKMWEP
jgi:hypothetical protein